MEQTPAGSGVADWFKRNGSLIALVVAFTFFVLPHVSPFESLNYYLSSIQRLSRWMLEKIQDLFADYGYYLVFFGVLLENSMFLGFLVPGALILILAGLAAENGSINIWWVLGLGISATIIGDTMSYFIGRAGWTRVLQRGGMGEMIERVRVQMESHSSWIILAYHFAGYSRVVGPAAAGMFRIPYRRWAFYDYIGGTIWVIAFTALGYVLGVAGLDFSDTKQVAQVIEWIVLALLIVAVLAVYSRATRAGGDDSDGHGGDGGQPATVIVPVDRE